MKTAGQTAYESFYEESKGVDGAKNPLKKWEELGGEIQGKWEARAKQVADEAAKRNGPDAETVARELYTSYVGTIGVLPIEGSKELPPWDDFRTDPDFAKETEAWMAVARKAIKLLQ